MLQMALLIIAAQVSGLPLPPICTHALAAEFGSAASEICLGEEEAQRADSAEKDSPERRRQFEAAAQHYRRGANLTTNSDLKARAIHALSILYTQHLQEFDQAELVLRELIALTPDDLKPVFQLAKLQEDRGWIDRAESTLIEARRQRPEDLEPYKMLAQFYARRVSAMSLQSHVAKPAQSAQRDDQGVYRQHHGRAEGDG